jgi:deoxyribonuclease-4
VRFGGHVSTSGGLSRAVERGIAIGAECIQIFVAAPQQWRAANHSDDAVAAFLEANEAAGFSPPLIHALYLLNLASPDPALRRKSADALVSLLSWSDRLGALGVVFHPGSAMTDSRDVGIERAVDSLSDVLERSSAESPLLLETTAGSGATIGSRFEDLGEIIERLGRPPRMQVCLDTCHIFAAGYACLTPDELDQTMADFDRLIGLDRLTALHLNDSKGELGSHKDRHDNIGEGKIGFDGFRAIVNHPALKELPAFLEVPGFDGEGPDEENLRRLRSLVTQVFSG